MSGWDDLDGTCAPPSAADGDVAPYSPGSHAHTGYETLEESIGRRVRSRRAASRGMVGVASAAVRLLSWEGLCELDPMLPVSGPETVRDPLTDFVSFDYLPDLSAGRGEVDSEGKQEKAASAGRVPGCNYVCCDNDDICMI